MLRKLKRPFYQYRPFELVAIKFLSERDSCEFNPDDLSPDLVLRLASADKLFTLTNNQAIEIVKLFEADGLNAYSQLSPNSTLSKSEIDFFAEYEKQMK